MACCLELPEEILELILECVALSFFDYIRFGLVCRHWRSLAIRKRHIFSRRLPMLLHSQKWFKIGAVHDKDLYNFYNMCEDKLLEVKVPKIGRSAICGISHGWITTISLDSSSIELVNPFSGDRIPLPSLDTFSDPQDSANPERERNYDYISKAILSSDPHLTPNYVVMAIVCNKKKLSFCKPGDERWTTITLDFNGHDDVVYHQGLFYAINHRGCLLSCDVGQLPPKVTEIAPPLKRSFYQKYLVVSSGDLLYVARHLKIYKQEENPLRYKTVLFEVFKLDWSKHEWVEVKSLGNQMLFLGTNHSLSLTIDEYPQLLCNHIYFTDDFYEGGVMTMMGSHDLGVYNMEDESVSSFYPNPICFWPYAFFIMQNPQRRYE